MLSKHETCTKAVLLDACIEIVMNNTMGSGVEVHQPGKPRPGPTGRTTKIVTQRVQANPETNTTLNMYG
jgi:hypothetical protein